MDNSPFHGLRDYQVPHTKQLLRALLNNGAALDASDTGTGKGFCALTIARILGVAPLVIGPKAAKWEWVNAGAALGVAVEFVGYQKARGVSRKVNYHDPEIFGPSFIRLCSSEYGEEKPHGAGSYWVWKKPVGLLIFDEIHYCSGATSVQGKMLRSARKASQYVLMLSATAAEELTQLQNIGIVLGLFESKGYRNWLLRHGYTPGIFGGFVPPEFPQEAEAATAKVHATIFPARGARMRHSLIPNFPKTLIDVKLVGDGDDEKIARLIEEIFGCPPGDVRYGPLRQELDRHLVSHALDVAEDSLANKRKVVIFPKFTSDVDALYSALVKRKVKAAIIDGRQVGVKGDKERRSIKEAFQQNQLDALVVNQAAGSASLSLHDVTGDVERDTIIFPVESGRTLKQIFGRVQRDGGAFSRQFLLGFAGTIQEKILLQSLDKLRRIDSLNEGELDSIRL